MISFFNRTRIFFKRRIGRQALLGREIGKARIGVQMGDDGVDRCARSREEDIDAFRREQDGAQQAQCLAARGEIGLECLAIGEGDELVAGNIDDGHGKNLFSKPALYEAALPCRGV